MVASSVFRGATIAVLGVLRVQRVSVEGGWGCRRPPPEAAEGDLSPLRDMRGIGSRTGWLMVCAGSPWVIVGQRRLPMPLTGAVCAPGRAAFS
jgi:hypothetical protein